MKVRMIEAGPLKSEMREFLSITGLSPSTIGRYAMNDPGFINRLGSQSEVRLSTADKLRQYMLNVIDGSNEKRRVALCAKIKEEIADCDTKSVHPPKSDVIASKAENHPDNPDAIALLAEIDAYLARLPNMTQTKLGEAALRTPGFVGLLRKRGWLKAETAEKVRLFMKDYPDGFEGKFIERAPVKVGHPVRAAKRELPAPTVFPKGDLPLGQEIEKSAPPAKAVTAPQEPLSGSPAGLGARFQEIALEDSLTDAVRVVQAAWPDTWRRLCQKARDRNMRPVSLMVELLEGA